MQFSLQTVVADLQGRYSFEAVEDLLLVPIELSFKNPLEFGLGLAESCPELLYLSFQITLSTGL